MKYVPKILIVDDTIDNLKVVGSILQSERFDIALSTNCEDAINVLLTNEIDLILMDIMIPQVDGLETCRQIKRIEALKEIPIIFLTAKTQTTDMLEAFEAGGVDYVFKPFNRQELLARVNTHVELYLSRRKLKELYKNRDMIYSIIAHDIKAPFNKINQFLSMLDGGFIECGSADYFELLHLLGTETQKTTDLINKLIDWGNVLLHENTLHLQPNCLKTMIDTTIAFFKPQIEAKFLQIENQTTETNCIMCHEKSMEVVLRNLLANAIKFTPDGGKITFSTEENYQKTSIYISDSGVGMSEDAIQSIFVKHVLYHTQGTNDEKGSGLGLQIVQDLVKKNNAELKVSSIPGKGTTFTLNIDKAL